MSRILKLIRYYERMQEQERDRETKFKKAVIQKCVKCALIHNVEEICVTEKTPDIEDEDDLLKPGDQRSSKFFRTPSLNTLEQKTKKQRATENVSVERDKKETGAELTNRKKEKSPTVNKKGLLFERKNKKSENKKKSVPDLVTKKNKLFGPEDKMEGASVVEIKRHLSKEGIPEIKGVSVAAIKRHLSREEVFEPKEDTFSDPKNMKENSVGSEVKKETTFTPPKEKETIEPLSSTPKIILTTPEQTKTIDTTPNKETLLVKTTKQKPSIAQKPIQNTYFDTISDKITPPGATPDQKNALGTTPKEKTYVDTIFNEKTSTDNETNRKTSVDKIPNQISPDDIIHIQKTFTDTTPNQKTPIDTVSTQKTPIATMHNQKTIIDTTSNQKTHIDTTSNQNTSIDTMPNDKTLIDTTSYHKTPIDTTPNQKSLIDSTHNRKTPVDTIPNQKTPIDTTNNRKTSVDKTPDQKMSIDTTPNKKTSIDTAPNQKTSVNTTPNKEVPLETEIKKESIIFQDSPTASSALIEVLAEEGAREVASGVKDGTTEQTSGKQFLGASNPEKETGVPEPHIDNGARGEERKVVAPSVAQGETKKQEAQLSKELKIDATENNMSKNVTDAPEVTSTNTAVSGTNSRDEADGINSKQNVNNREYPNNLEGKETEYSGNLNNRVKENVVEEHGNLVNLRVGDNIDGPKRTLTIKALEAFSDAVQPMKRVGVYKERKSNSMDIDNRFSAASLADRKKQIIWRGKIIRWQKSYCNIKEVGLADDYIKTLTKTSDGPLKRTGPMPDLRYVSGEEEGYGDSESESDSDNEHLELNILRVTTDSNRHSGSSDTHSQDSGISGQGLQTVEHVGTGDSQAKRPISAVPSEYSDISVDSEDLIRLKKVYEIANELLTTEITYVSKLHLIDQVFHFRVDHENRAQNMFPQEIVTTIFSNIKSIYKFHADFLLPQLKERMDRWHDGEKYQRIGDIIGKNAPYLKMYTEYVKNFDNAMGAINTWYSKSSKFAQIMDSIHSLPESGSLTLQHHMLSPIQRIPRYEMLLKEYLKKLPQDSPDRADSEKALQQVSLAATHANDAMNRIEQFKKLLEIQESIGGDVDLVSPTREVIKQGKIVKISARSGDHQERYLFLFSDLLLLCSPRRNMMNAGPQYALRAKFEVDNMQVLEGDNLVTANTFYVRDDHKSVELYTHIREEKEDWLESLFQTIKQLYQKKSSLRVGREMLRPLDSEIGKKQPHLQKMETILKCMECTVQFSILKHKHHCKSCGAVVCAKCSDYRHPLPWEDNRKVRVCKSCNNILKCSDQASLSPPPPQDYLPVRPKGLLEVHASTPAVHSGWLVLRPPKGTAAKAAKRFFLLLPDFVLYSFRTETDSCALTATPLPGFTVQMGHDIKGDSNVPEKDKEKIIKLSHPSSKKLYYFAGTSAEEVDRWGEILKMAARAELPPGCSHLVSDTQSTSSTEYENG